MESMADFEKELTNSFRVMKAGERVKGMIVDINDEARPAKPAGSPS